MAAGAALTRPEASRAGRTRATGRVVAGHGVASGRAADSPFGAGTIPLQTPFFAAEGVDLSHCWPGTVNLDVAPFVLRLRQPRRTLTDVAWTDVHPPETFSFVDCRVRTTSGGEAAEGPWVDGLVYVPHPETKPMHHQPSTVVELLMPWVEGLSPGTALELEVTAGQAELALPEGGHS